jgi:hypothetical protein
LRRDASGRPPLLLQLVIVGAFLGFYDYIRDLTPGRENVAISNARYLLDLERGLHLDVERAMNHWLSMHHGIGYIGGTLYDSLHYLITMPLLLAVYVWWPGTYRRLRDILIVVNLLGLVVFWALPTAPPRLTTGPGAPTYVDIVAQTGALGGTAAAAQKQVDQYAAMPSLHIGWAIWVTLVIFAVTTHRGWRALGVAYPLATVVIIVSTGNHWLFDAVAGAACLFLAILAVDVVLRGVRPTRQETPSEGFAPVR